MITTKPCFCPLLENLKNTGFQEKTLFAQWQKGRFFGAFQGLNPIRKALSICLDIKLYNKFWKKFYFSLTYTLIAINLVLLQLILFDQILLLFCVILSAHLAKINLLSMFNLMTASINSEASKSYKSLLEMYFKTNFILNTNRKMKVN